MLRFGNSPIDSSTLCALKWANGKIFFIANNELYSIVLQGVVRVDTQLVVMYAIYKIGCLFLSMIFNYIQEWFMKIFKKTHNEVDNQQSNTYVYEKATFSEHEFKSDFAPEVSNNIKHKNKCIKGKKPK